MNPKMNETSRVIKRFLRQEAKELQQNRFKYNLSALSSPFLQNAFPFTLIFIFASMFRFNGEKAKSPTDPKNGQAYFKKLYMARNALYQIRLLNVLCLSLQTMKGNFSSMKYVHSVFRR